MMETNNRQYNIDILRLICALLVVCIHCTNYSLREYILPITRIAVPIFFIISGYFLYSDNNEHTKSKIGKSIKKISKIYIISLIVFFIYAFIDGFINNNFNAIKIGPWKLFVFITNCSSLFFPYDFHLWFLIALIQGLILFYPLCKSITNNIRTAVAISFIFLLLNPILTNTEINIFNKIYFIPFFKVIFLSLPYLIIGYYLRSKPHIFNTPLLYTLLCFFIILAMIESQYFNRENYHSTLFLSIIVFSIFRKMKGNRNIINFWGEIGQKHRSDLNFSFPCTFSQ